MTIRAGIAGLGVFLSLAASALAADEVENNQELIEELRQQLEILQRQSDAKTRALLQLEQRLRRLEAEEQAQGAPAGQGATTRSQSIGQAPAQAPSSGYGLTLKKPEPNLGSADQRARAAASQADDTETTEADGSGLAGDQPPRKRQADQSQSVDDVVSEIHTLFGSGRLTVEPGVSYSLFDRSDLNLGGFLALDAIFLGTINVDQIESQIVTTDLSLRYSPTNRLQVDVNVPYVFRFSEFQTTGAGGGSTTQIDESLGENNLGDVSFGFSYRLYKEKKRIPDIVLSGRGRAPTGVDPFGIETVVVSGSEGNLTIPTELPTGNGVWAATGGISLLKTIDPAVLFANGRYTYRLTGSFADIGAADGNQAGEIKLGDVLDFGAGIAYALNEKLSLSLAYSQQFVFEAQQRAAGTPDFVNIVGSDANVATLNFGATWAASKRLTVVTNVAPGISEDASDLSLSVKFPFRF